MNRHQVLTGAANNYDFSVSIGSVENNYFIAYASGYNIVILASNFERVQIISGIKHGNLNVKCVDCTLDTGKIAASYGNCVTIYEPTPSAKKSSHNLFYKWIHIGTINLDSLVIAISWNMETNRLLIGCNTIQMWSYKLKSNDFNENGNNNTEITSNSNVSNTRKVEFMINDNENNNNNNHVDISNDNLILKWKKIWEAKVANPLKFLQFSPDGTLFASYGENDRLVKIWYEVRSPTSVVTSNDNTQHNPEYHFIYLSHPRAVTSLQWRRISKFMPRGMVANTLITSCKDNICRIWAETILPDDGLIRTNQQEEISYASIAETSRHKRTVLNKLHKMRLNSHFPHLLTFPFTNSKSINETSMKQGLTNNYSYSTSNSVGQLTVADHQQQLNINNHSLTTAITSPNFNSLSSQASLKPDSTNNITTTTTLKLQNSQSCQDFYLKHNIHNSNSDNIMNIGFHFHLAGFINAENGSLTRVVGIPLNQNLNQNIKGVNFIVNWVNNKDFTFTLAAELISRELYEKLRKIQMENELKTPTPLPDDEQDVTDNIPTSIHINDINANIKRSKFVTDLNFNETLNESTLSSVKLNATLNDGCNLSAIDEETKSILLSSSMDQKLDTMIKDWFNSHDMLFCIHPIDGSILVWLVDWLDEYMPNGYRQAQISFHARLPNAIPVGDAMSMRPQLFLFAAAMPIFNKHVRSNNNNISADENSETDNNNENIAVNIQSEYTNLLNSQGVINMVSKHLNGTLNLWQMTFQEASKYQSLVNILHLSRICGHRLRVNDITCHPTLPLLLSNSNSHLTDSINRYMSSPDNQNNSDWSRQNSQQDSFQTGLIIWRVEPVGPLSKSGGIYELARVDSTKLNSFENIAWFPCFLPSSTLGNVSSSPSTLFASTDSECITIYQAVLDARTLLHEMQAYAYGNSNQKHPIRLTSNNLHHAVNTTDIPYNSFNVVSIQSTARPGCIIELDKIVDSEHNWQKAHLFHLFQEDLITNMPTSTRNLHAHATMTNIQQQQQTQADSTSLPSQSMHNLANTFNENFFLVLLEKANRPAKPVIHMWKLTIISMPLNIDDTIDGKKFQPDTKIKQLIRNRDTNEADLISLRSDSFDFAASAAAAAASSNVPSNKNRITITSSKVCTQELCLPDNVQIICADPAAADLSSSCMFTLSKVPYLFATACSDGVIRFWTCDKVEKTSLNGNDASIDEEYKFFEWIGGNSTSNEATVSTSLTTSMSNSTIESVNETKIKGYPLAISCAYNGRFAIAYKLKQQAAAMGNFDDKDDNLFMNICVRIYECESTGGSSWKLEDCIHLENIKLPEIESGIDFDYIYGNEKPIHPSKSAQSFKNILFNSNDTKTPEIPSSIAKFSVRQQFVNQRQRSINSSISYLTRLVQLDWASMENGSHILTVGIANKIFIYSCVSRNLDELRLLSNKDASQSSKNSSMTSVVPNMQITYDPTSRRRNSKKFTIEELSRLKYNEEKDENDLFDLKNSLLKWVQFRLIELDSVDSMQALPVQMKWVRDGLLIVGLDTEMQVFSQWSTPSTFITSFEQTSSSTTTTNALIEVAKKQDDEKKFLKIKQATTNGIIPKNPSVLDLNMLARSNRFKTENKKEHIKSVKFADNLIEKPQQQKKESHPSHLVFDDSKTLDFILDSGLFLQAKREWPVLPQYHPKQLIELMNAGKINRVKAILMHLTRCIIDCEFNAKKSQTKKIEKKLKRTLSISCSESEVPEEHNLNYIEIESIPPLPMFALNAADNDIYIDTANELNQLNAGNVADKGFQNEDNNNNDDDNYNELFEKRGETDNDKDDVFKVDEFLNNEEGDDVDDETRANSKATKEAIELKKRLLSNNNTNNAYYFNSQVCNILNDYLMHVRLAGLEGLDQMYLVALADTVANVKCDVTFNQNEDIFLKREHNLLSSNTTSGVATASNRRNSISGNNSIDNEVSKVNSQIVDNCGLKYLLALRHYNYLMRTLPIANRTKLIETGIGTSNFAWAYHSECEQELLNSIPKIQSAIDLKWTELKQYGIGWWIKNPNLMRTLIEKLAKCAFQAKNDPLDAALYYIAMKKKGVLWGLFKTIKDIKMTEFFKNDFNEQRWQTAALKNAYALLGKQRFEHAAAFFLLAGKLKDAVEVCLRSLHDIQLAFMIIRLYETDVDQMNAFIKQILLTEILGYNDEKNKYEIKNASKDPFLRSIAYWYLKEYNLALSTLYDVDIGNNSNNNNNNSFITNEVIKNDCVSSISDVFNFYTFLKNHPLVMRQQAIKVNRAVRNSISEEKIRDDASQTFTTIERRLHFQTAYYHIINGCPLLTLDVLSKLPKYIVEAEADNEVIAAVEEEMPKDEPVVVEKKIEKADDFDWSNSLSTNTNRRFEEEKLELDLGFSDDDDEDEDTNSSDDEKKPDNSKNVEVESKKPTMTDANTAIVSKNVKKIVDLFAQQLKFISCLKILIEEMSTLATGFEVTGGQLRFYMYYWLERETNILKDLNEYQCGVCESKLNMTNMDESSSQQQQGVYCTDTYGLLLNTDTNNEHDLNESDQLHEQVIKDQKTFQLKVQRLNRRKLWLRSNELLLRTLLSYCSLHSAHGGGLASVRMELILLMQELTEDRGIKQLLSPLPLPTTIPLLTAIVVSSKTVVAGPIRMIQSLINDILLTITDLQQHIPTIFDSAVVVSTIKELSVSLSACIYQCLCDSDAFSVPKSNVVTGMQGFCKNLRYKSTYLMSGLRQSVSSIGDLPKIDSSPKNWPGVSSLIKLLDREQDIEAPKLKVVLLESLIGVYSALLLNAFVFYDCSTLWRLLAQQWNSEMWGKLFGGGCKTEYKYKTVTNVRNLDSDSAKYRLKMNAKLGHVVTNTTQEDKIFIREHFIAPQISMINFFLAKPDSIESMGKDLNYDTDEEGDGEGDRDENENFDMELTYGKRYQEHMNPNSYSWCLMRYAIVKYVLINITSFLGVVGIEPNELPILSPIVHGTLKTFENWLNLLRANLNSFNGPPDDYIPGCTLNNNSNFNGPKLLKYQSMLDPSNTPFANDRSANSAKRLWHFLVTRKCLYDIFIRYIFKKKNAPSQLTTIPTSVSISAQLSATESTKKGDVTSSNVNFDQTSSYKIIHKDQEAIHGFCLNERDKTMLALCTSKEIIEMDIKNLLTKNVTIDDECEMDILAMQSSRSNVDSDMLVIGNSNDPYTQFTLNEPPKNTPSIKKQSINYNSVLSHPYSAFLIAERTKYLIPKMIKRNIKEIRRLASHPTLPYYLSGSHEGVVKLWHWGSNDPLSSCKQGDKSLSAKVTKLQFNTHGNKFGVSDAEGYLHLYQLLGCSFKSYMTLRCHKVMNDFTFVDSSSLLFTVGVYNDAYEVSLWDTLMPPSKALTMCFREPDIPSATCAAYSPIYHFAYVGNRKGDVKIYDLRMHKIIQKLVAHESSVKAITIDPDEYYLATGSSEGNIKIWNLKNLNLLHSYHGDHSKSSLIRNFNAGVNQLYFTNDNQLISCGTDGAILIRNFNSSTFES